MFDDENQGWYAVQVKRREEHCVVRRLGVQGVPTFLPLMESFLHHRRDGDRLALEPLFPGYVFVQLDTVGLNARRWHIARWTPGVRRILGAEHGSDPMPAEAMAEIQARVRELGFVRHPSRFTKGDRVRMRSGPLEGLEAVFDRPISREGRVLVLLELLGQAGRAEVDEASLDAA